MKILTSLFVGTCMLVGSALAAQSNPAPKPATTPATQSKSTPKTVQSKKHRRHNKAVTSKSAKSVGRKSATPVAPVAMKKKPAVK
jgi:hypothetical protein